MTSAEKTRCWIYAAIALAALVGTQWTLIDYLVGPGSVGDFVDATVDGHAAIFVTIDLLAVALAATVFMVVEGRRVRVPMLWLYVVLVFAVAVSVAFPLFLIARTSVMAAARDSL